MVPAFIIWYNRHYAEAVARIFVKINLFILSAAISAFFCAAALAGEPAAAAPAMPAGGAQVPAAGSFNLDINYPGAAVRYFPASGRGLELFGQGQDKIFTGGFRYYYYPAGLAGGALCPYLAAEAAVIGFKGRYSRGTGAGGGLYGGVEYFPGRRVSVQTDIGAFYLSIKDKNTSLGESGLEFVINLGFNLYFGGGKP